MSKGILTEVPTTVHEVKRDLQGEGQTVYEATYNLLRRLGLTTIFVIADAYVRAARQLSVRSHRICPGGNQPDPA
jgi:hypothetical protein